MKRNIQKVMRFKDWLLTIISLENTYKSLEKWLESYNFTNEFSL